MNSKKVLQYLLGEMAREIARGGGTDNLERLVMASPSERTRMLKAHREVIEARMERVIADAKVTLKEMG
jgi:hypothetical protein